MVNCKLSGGHRLIAIFAIQKIKAKTQKQEKEKNLKKLSLPKDENARMIIKVSLVTILVNLILIVVKIVLGFVFDNLAVVSDAVHSALDVLIPFILIAAAFFFSSKSDSKFHYGREKVESLIALLLSILIGGLSIFLVYEGIIGIISPNETEVNYYLIGITIFSIAVKEGMFWYKRYYSKRMNSAMLKADAWHSRIDSLSSVAVLLGLLSSFFMETDLVESIATILVALFILKVAYEIIKPAIGQLIDRSAGENVSEQIQALALQTEGVQSVGFIRTRLFGNQICVDLEIAVNGNLSVSRSHDIAHAVQHLLESDETLHIKHCSVHVNPAGEKISIKTEAEPKKV